MFESLSPQERTNKQPNFQNLKLNRVAHHIWYASRCQWISYQPWQRPPVLEEPHAQAFPCAVVLADERTGERFCRVHDVLPSDRSHRSRGVRMPWTASAAYCVISFSSSWSARLVLMTRQPWDPSHASTAEVSSGP